MSKSADIVRELVDKVLETTETYVGPKDVSRKHPFWKRPDNELNDIVNNRSSPPEHRDVARKILRYRKGRADRLSRLAPWKR